MKKELTSTPYGIYNVERNDSNLKGIFKILEKSSGDVRRRHILLREIRIMQEQPAKGWMPEFYSSGEHEGKSYYIMEAVNALPEHLPEAEAISVIRDVAHACSLLRTHPNEYFHAGLHRSHIGRRGDGRAVLMGIGHVFTKNQALIAPESVHSPIYRAPEALAEGWINERAEIYALGRLLSDLLDGHSSQHMKDFVSAATAKDPNERIASIPEFLARLESCRVGLTSAAERKA